MYYLILWHTHAPSRDIKYVTIDNQVCFHRRLFANPVKPHWYITRPMEPLGTTKQNWCGVKIYQCLSPPILWIVYIFVIYWEHRTIACALMAGWAHFGLPPIITTLPPTHPPLHIQHPWYYRGCKKLSHKPAVNTVRKSLLWNTSYKTALVMQQIWCGYNITQENHSWFNTSK